MMNKNLIYLILMLILSVPGCKVNSDGEDNPMKVTDRGIEEEIFLHQHKAI